VEAEEVEPGPSRQVISLIAELYRIEDEAKEMTPEDRLTQRKQKSVIVLGEIKQFLEAQVGLVLPQSPFGKAVSYTLGQWPGLIRYAELDGRLGIDNNSVERAIRPLALGRHNWLFAGSIEGAERMAMLYSLIFTLTFVVVLLLVSFLIFLPKMRYDARMERERLRIESELEAQKMQAIAELE
jgi:hypothetical protein